MISEPAQVRGILAEADPLTPPTPRPTRLALPPAVVVVPVEGQAAEERWAEAMALLLKAGDIETTEAV